MPDTTSAQALAQFAATAGAINARALDRAGLLKAEEIKQMHDLLQIAENAQLEGDRAFARVLREEYLPAKRPASEE